MFNLPETEQLSWNETIWKLHEDKPSWVDRDERPVPILINKVHPDAKPLTKKRSTDVAWDVSCVTDASWQFDANGDPYYDLLPSKSHTFRTGIKVAVPGRYGFLIRDRSGMGISDIIHTAGVIEGTYRGEWMIHLINLGDTTHLFKVGDRIVQAVLIPIFPAEIRMVAELPDSDRGTKGFESSGR